MVKAADTAYYIQSYSTFSGIYLEDFKGVSPVRLLVLAEEESSSIQNKQTVYLISLPTFLPVRLCSGCCARATKQHVLYFWLLLALVLDDATRPQQRLFQQRGQDEEGLDVDLLFAHLYGSGPPLHPQLPPVGFSRQEDKGKKEEERNMKLMLDAAQTALSCQTPFG